MSSDHPRRIPIEWNQFSFTYAGASVPALNQFSLNLEPGERVLVMGQSGCGKSTLGLTLNGIIPRTITGTTSGYVHVGNSDPSLLPLATMAAQVALVFQDPDSQLCTLNTRDEIAFGPQNLRIRRNEILNRLQAAAEFVGIDNLLDDSVFDLSGGQKQRVAIAAALAMAPSVLVLDEPTANLDPTGRKEVTRILQKLLNQLNMTTITVEHHPGDLMKISDRVLIMSNGGIMATGAPRELMSNYGMQLIQNGIRLPAASVFFLHLRGGAEIPLSLDEIDFDELVGPVSGSRPIHKNAQRTVTSKPILQIRDVSFSYLKGREVLRDISLDIDAGEVVALLGSNGSGKSTLASLLAGLNRPSAGTIRIADKEVSRMSARDLSRRIGYVFQYPEHQFITDRVDEEVAISIRRMGYGNVASTTRNQLERFDLSQFADRHPFKLSLGQKRRLSIAAMAVYRPDLLILDEPTFGQDQGHTDTLASTVRELSGEGMSVLMITHDLRLMADIAHRAIVVSKGSIVFDGAPEDLLELLENGARWGLEPLEEYSLWNAVAKRHTEIPFTSNPRNLAATLKGR
jgi:energy-coupling factor transporter ATP-binding protein EcfA2